MKPSPDSPDHAAAATAFLADEARAGWHDHALWLVRRKRDRAAAAVPEWEALRTLASAVKAHTLSRLDDYLLQFEAQARANGFVVHWAEDADAHNALVYDLLCRHGAQRIVKSKSMLTEECGLNPYLEARGIEVVDTDLGERIVQLGGEPPSHIVMPAIHRQQEEIGALFHARMGTPEGLSDPAALTAAARADLRARFLRADAALTGVNFAVAETGGFVVCTNEGNADLGVHLAPLHIASMGLEKIIPKAEHLGIFLRLLARSATGQALTVYTSHFHRPAPGQAVHLVLVDNGRTAHLGREGFRDALKCIRCGACLNTCPVYRRSGGHSYGAVVPGPIGAVLMPGVDPDRYASLPFASTLCGSCTDVCPVKIDLHGQLYRWRQVLGRRGGGTASKAWAMRLAGGVLSRPRLYRMAGAVLRFLLRRLPRRLTRRALGPWGRHREWPDPQAERFGTWYEKQRRTP